MDTKKINETPILEQATAETNVLVEQNGAASRIPASALGGGGGGVDEKTIIEKLAPAFTKTGAVVTCNPVEGHPLEVVSHIKSGIVDFTPVENNWSDEYTGDPALLIAGLPAGEYTLNTSSENSADIRVVAYDAESGTMEEICAVDYDENGIEATATFTHNGGDLLITDEGWVGVNNIKLTAEISEFTSVSLIHNGKTRKVELPEAVSHGKFTWSSGVLSIPNGNPNLIPVDLSGGNNWSESAEDGCMVYILPNLPKGQYTLYAEVIDALDIQYYDGLEMSWASAAQLEAGDTVVTFNHPGGDLRLVDVSWMVTEGGITQTPIKLEAGAEHTEDGFDTFQLTVHEILGLPGVNTLQSTTGDTEVSGTANPAAVFAEQEARIAALEAALSKE